MIITLLKNGQGLPHCETVYIKSNKIPIEVIGAPEFSILTIITEKRSIRKNLDKNGKCEIEISDVLGEEIRFSVNAVGAYWNCDGIRVDKTDEGTIRVSSCANYPDKLNSCFGMIEDLKTRFSKLEAEIEKLREEEERRKSDYSLV